MAQHWLTRPATARMLWVVFAVVLGATVLAEHFIVRAAHFELEAWWGFNAVYGFLACAVMILLAKGIGVLLKRREDYYRDE